MSSSMAAEAPSRALIIEKGAGNSKSTRYAPPTVGCLKISAPIDLPRSSYVLKLQDVGAIF